MCVCVCDKAARLNSSVECLQELGASGDQEGPVCSGEAGSSAHGRDHQTVPDVGQTSAPGGLAGQRGDQPAHT